MLLLFIVSSFFTVGVAEFGSCSVYKHDGYGASENTAEVRSEILLRLNRTKKRAEPVPTYCYSREITPYETKQLNPPLTLHWTVKYFEGKLKSSVQQSKWGNKFMDSDAGDSIDELFDKCLKKIEECNDRPDIDIKNYYYRVRITSDCFLQECTCFLCSTQFDESTKGTCPECELEPLQCRKLENRALFATNECEDPKVTKTKSSNSGNVNKCSISFLLMNIFLFQLWQRYIF